MFSIIKRNQKFGFFNLNNTPKERKVMDFTIYYTIPSSPETIHKIITTTTFPIQVFSRTSLLASRRMSK